MQKSEGRADRIIVTIYKTKIKLCSKLHDSSGQTFHITDKKIKINAPPNNISNNRILEAFKISIKQAGTV